MGNPGSASGLSDSLDVPTDFLLSANEVVGR